MSSNFSFYLFVFTFVVFSPCFTWAQFDESEGEKEVEQLYDKIDANEDKKRSARKKRQRKRVEKPISRLSELSTLAPFDDVAVISKKFLPKTSRYEVSGSLITGLNNAFFSLFGLNANFAYYFKEKHGVEFTYSFLTDSKRSVTDNLETNRNVDTTSLVLPESFVGISYKWIPMYGKMAFFNRSIVPFDTYFAPGVGLTKTKEGHSETTFHARFGQIFAISKSFAIRWDFTWNFYQARARERDTSGNFQDITKSHSDLLLSLGASFFFPEAKYR